MRIVQFETAEQGRRLGIVTGELVRDLTAARPEWKRLIDVFHEADAADRRMAELIEPAARLPDIPTISYEELLASALHPPVDHQDPHRVLVSGTGLTHLGGMQSRHQMHAGSGGKSQEPKTDSKKMFEMGVAGGKPAAGERGVAPEWFYKGNGDVLHGHRQTLEIPAFTRDGGEEAEVVGCYVIDRRGVPRRLGFALGNEWSDHATEKLNYLYLAPSKLRQCAVGPELWTDFDFQQVTLRSTVRRRGQVIYDSGELASGEAHMCHSLANCEDHHFKYPQHRRPGDVHLHFFGTSKLSYGSRNWQYEEGDEIRIESLELGAPLVNAVQVGNGPEGAPVRVLPV